MSVLTLDIESRPAAFAALEADVQSRRCNSWRRVIDVVLAMLILLVCVPMLLAIALVVWTTDRGPIFFSQGRVGRDGRPFKMLKFRSMVVDAEDRLRREPGLYGKYVENDFKLDITEDPRITRAGRVLRSTSLDELPQLFNVIRGDMSLVGPRPVVPSELSNYGPYTNMVFSVRPGMTGLWQVSGRNDVVYPERVLLDAEYVQRRSVRQDLNILMRTPLAVLNRRGVS